MEFVNGGNDVDVAVIVVTYNSAKDIGGLIASLRKSSGCHSFRLIVVDNKSSDDTLSVIGEHHDIILVEAAANLGYAAGINLGLKHTGKCSYVLILNPDLTVSPAAIDAMISAAEHHGVGAVVPLILDGNGQVSASLHREPSIIRCFCDSVFGAKLASRIGLASGSDFRPASYQRLRDDIDWAVGAAMLIPVGVIRLVGDWTESFFLYAEEADYFRRIRDHGFRVHFVPSAVVRHRGGGSGTSDELSALLAVNRIRYIEKYHGPIYSAVFRFCVVIGLILRSHRSASRCALHFVASRRTWGDLPHASRD